MLLKLKWYIKNVKKEEGKEVKVYYILVPAKIAPFLEKYEPYLDLEKKMIIFKESEGNE
jgi:hypothetical protein